MTNHAAIMQRALDLALRGKGRVHPNPLVGCVLVKNGRVVGEGYHARYGGPHAEQKALAKAGSRARGATAYLNLEPCAHWGKTPPCAPALINAGVREVFVADKDPNPVVNGKGLALLRKAGVKVHLGLAREAAQAINRPFRTWMTQKRPFVLLKMAATLDGKIASSTGDSKWISSVESRRLVHQLRSESDAVLIGASTAMADNPTLTSHGVGRDPIRIVLDPHLRTSDTLKLYRPSKQPTWLITSRSSSDQRRRRMEKSGHKILRVNLNSGRFQIRSLLKLFSQNNVSQLLVEGGGETAWGFVSAKAVDEVMVFLAPKILGGRRSPTWVEGPGFNKVSQAMGFKMNTIRQIGSDLLIRGRLA